MSTHPAARHSTTTASGPVRASAAFLTGLASGFRRGLRIGRVPDSCRRQRETFVRRLPGVVLAIGIVINAAVLISHADGVWFWADDWDFLFMRGTIPEYDIGWLAPHNNHWLTAHILV